jgi:hypothetical protein
VWFVGNINQSNGREKGIRSCDLKQLNEVELQGTTSCNSETRLKELCDVYMTPGDADDVYVNDGTA